MVERLVFLGSTTHIYLRLGERLGAAGARAQRRGALPYSQGTPVSVALPSDALRVLPDSGVSIAEIQEETIGEEDQLDLTGTGSSPGM